LTGNAHGGKLAQSLMQNDLHPEESSPETVFALLLNKSAIGIYTSYEKAEAAWDVFKREETSGSWNYQIKPFELDGPARVYLPY
jgi:hypothetical protein